MWDVGCGKRTLGSAKELKAPFQAPFRHHNPSTPSSSFQPSGPEARASWNPELKAQWAVGFVKGRRRVDAMASHVACRTINLQHRHHGLVTRSGSQISRLTPLVWDDEWGGLWGVGSGEWGVGCGLWEKTSRIVEGTKGRLFRRCFVTNNRILHLVIPAKRAGGPRELESMA